MQHTWRAAAVAVVTLSMSAFAAPTSSATVQWLKQPTARCMDGSPAAYYFRPGVGENATKFILHLQGGGECTTESACTSKLNTALGSSRSYGPTRTLGWYQSADANSNPDLWSWSAAYLMYCSQDLHSGQRSTASNDTWGVLFSGRLNFLAMLADMQLHHNLAAATDIILSGDSAGGIGVWYHLDDLAHRFPDARVVGAPIAGFYFWADPYMGPYSLNGSGLADFREPAWPQHYALWDSFIDASCASSNAAAPWMCMLSNTSYPWISTPTFVTEAQTDKVVLVYHDWVPSDHLTDPNVHSYLEQWHHNMTDVALAPVFARGDGVFNAACFLHTGFSPTQPLIDGASFLQTFGNWYFNRTGATQLKDDCGVMCNPTCPGV